MAQPELEPHRHCPRLDRLVHHLGNRYFTPEDVDDLRHLGETGQAAIYGRPRISS